MTIGESLSTCFKKYATFSGRAMRSEFWWFMLFTTAIGIAIDLALPALGSVWSLATLIPTLAVSARRLHDIDRTGWWQILPVIGLPLVGYGAYDAFEIGGDFWTPAFIIGAIIMAATYILLIVWYATKGTDGPNRFGDDPFGPGGDAEVFD